MPFLHTRAWKEIPKREDAQRKAQRVNRLKTDEHPNPDYKLPHSLLLTRKKKTGR